MRFKEFYEATITHEPSGSDRIILKHPNIVPMPYSTEGKRLVTIVNSDDSYFTFIFDKDAHEPMGVVIGNSENANGAVHNDVNIAKKLYNKHYTPFATGDMYTYKGEARIHPPFEGYREFPQDISAYFFTDFDNLKGEYISGETISDKYTKIK